jgi:hypothetical protein
VCVCVRARARVRVRESNDACAVRGDAHHEVSVEKDAVANGLAKALDHRRTPPAPEASGVG